MPAPRRIVLVLVASSAIVASACAGDDSRPACPLRGFDMVKEGYSAGFDAEHPDLLLHSYFAINAAGATLTIQVSMPAAGGQTRSAVDHVFITPPCPTGSCPVYKAESGWLDILVDAPRQEDSGTIRDARLVLTTADGTRLPADVWCLDDVDFEFDGTCDSDADCPTTGPNLCNPLDGLCYPCLSPFDCPAERPICDQSVEGFPCRAAGASCDGDDDLEPNDGPSAATPIALGQPIDAAVCDLGSGLGGDWYSVEVPDDRTSLEVRVTGVPKVGIVVYTEGSQLSAAAGRSDDGRMVVVPPLSSGRYFVEVRGVEGPTTNAYRLVVEPRAAECQPGACPSERHLCDAWQQVCEECASPDGFDCRADAPACVDDGVLGTCGSVDHCIDDDVPDDDDGPLAARLIAFGDSIDAHVCGAFGGDTDREADWYRFVVDEERFATVTLAWSDVDYSLTYRVIGAGGGVIAETEGPLTSPLVPGEYFIAVDASVTPDPHRATAYTLTLQ